MQQQCNKVHTIRNLDGPIEQTPRWSGLENGLIPLSGAHVHAQLLTRKNLWNMKMIDRYRRRWLYMPRKKALVFVFVLDFLWNTWRFGKFIAAGRQTCALLRRKLKCNHILLVIVVNNLPSTKKYNSTEFTKRLRVSTLVPPWAFYYRPKSLEWICFSLQTSGFILCWEFDLKGFPLIMCIASAVYNSID